NSKNQIPRTNQTKDLSLGIWFWNLVLTRLTSFPRNKKKMSAFEKLFVLLTCCEFRVSERRRKKNSCGAKNLLVSAGCSIYNPFSPSMDFRAPAFPAGLGTRLSGR